MKKALRLALLSAMVLIMVLTGTVCFASGDSGSVRFKDRFDDDYTELAVKGELSLGENTVSVNDGCYKFTAESAGYYGNYYPDDETATIMSVAKPSEDGIAEIIYTESGPGTAFDIVEDGNTVYWVFYIESPGTYYFSFETYDYENENPAPFSDKIVLTCLGDFVSYELSKDTFYIESDIFLWWKEENDTFCCFGENVDEYVNFTNGRFKTKMLGNVDKWESGKRTFTFDFGNGPDIGKEITLTGLADTIESVILPDDFRPVVSKRYWAIDPVFPDAKSDRSYTFPGWVELEFKDGSSVRIDPEGSGYMANEEYAEFEDGEGRSHWVFLQYTDTAFIVRVDGVTFTELKAEKKYNIIRDFLTLISNYIYHIKLFPQDLANDSLSVAITNLRDSMAGETNNFFEYKGYNRTGL